MIDIILLVIGLGGFGLAGYLDLKHTEFPDWLPYGMIASVIIIRLLGSFYLGSFLDFIQSIIVGSAFLGLGLLLFFFKQWGDGDAWLLGALGFFLPSGFMKFSGSLLPSYMSLLINFFLISFFYIAGYSILIGINRRDVRKLFVKKIKGEAKLTIAGTSVFLIIYSVFIMYINSITGILSRSLYIHFSLLFLVFFSVFFLQYAKAVESRLFRKKIMAKDVRVGDVLVRSRWKGLTEEETKNIKRKGGYVWIKEGVRFAPVYLITIIISVLFGSLLI